MTATREAVREAFGLDEDRLPLFPQRYNIPPTQPVVAVRQTPEGQREGVFLRWGLIPSWASDPGIDNRLINARSETVAEKPSFRSAFRSRRCLIVANGFYEWQKAATGKKQPYYFQLRGGQPFGFAGLWERWHAPDGVPIETCTILTTTANELLRPVHDRMPILLPPEKHCTWLDPAVRQPDKLLPLLRPFPAESMVSWPVSPHVTSPHHDDPRCIEPAG